MQLQFGKNSCPYLKQAAWNVKNQDQSQDIHIPDAMPDIGSILGTWGQVILRGKEWNGGRITVSGGIMVWVLYAPEDGSDARSLESWLPFQIRCDTGAEGADGEIRVSPLLRFADARSTSARKLTVRAGVSLLIQALQQDQADLPVPEEVPDDVQLLRQTYQATLPVEAGEKEIQLEETLELPASCPAATKILRFSMQPDLMDQKVMGDKVVFRGTARLHVLYCGEDGCLHCWDFEIPFSHYAELNREYEEAATADVMLALTNLELELQENQLQMKAAMTGQYLIYDRFSMELIQDIYSPKRDLKPQMEQLQIPMILENKKETLHLEKDWDPEQGEPLDLFLTTEHPAMRETADGFMMEFQGSIQILCCDADGKLSGQVQKWQKQWEMPTGDHCIVEPLAVPAGNLQQSGNLLRGDLALELVTMAGQSFSVAAGAEGADNFQERADAPSLILKKTGEDSLWDLAKSCHSTVNAIKEANQLAGEPEPEQLLLIPVCG